jgi:hypothetical protein
VTTLGWDYKNYALKVLRNRNCLHKLPDALKGAAFKEKMASFYACDFFNNRFNRPQNCDKRGCF